MANDDTNATDLTAVLNQIAKLTALAEHEATNPNEAANAAGKANRLMLRWNITKAQLEALGTSTKEEYIQSIIGKMDSLWNATLANVVAENNFCACVKNWSASSDPTRPAIQIIGQASNIKVVEYLYTYLLRTIRKLAREAWLEDGQGDGHTLTEGKFNRAFGIGAVNAIALRLKYMRQQAEQEVPTDSMALVVVKDADLKAAMAEFHPNLTKAIAYPKHDTAAKMTGFLAGSRIPLNQAIEGSDTKRIGGD